MTARQKGEVLGLLLLALGSLVLLSLIPSGWIVGGATGEQGAAAVNLAGPMGRGLARALARALGASRFLLPPVLLLWGWNRLRSGDWGRPLRATAFLLGGGLLAGGAMGLLAREAGVGRVEAAGAVPVAIGSALAAALGTLGAIVVLSLGLAVLLVVTTGVSVGAIAGGAEAVARGAGGAAAVVGRWGWGQWEAWRERRVKQRRAEAEVRIRRALEGNLAPARADRQRKPRAGKEPATQLELPTIIPAPRGGALRPAEGPSGPVTPGAAPIRHEPASAMSVGARERSTAVKERGGAPGRDREAVVASREAGASPGEAVPAMGDGIPAGGEAAIVPADSSYQLPSLSLLHWPTQEELAETQVDWEALGQVIVQKLADFNVKGEVVHISTGPVVSTFEFRPAPGIKVGQIVGLADDLALAMQASRIRIVAPLPGRGAVGIEVPNPRPRTVYLREVLTSEQYAESDAVLPLALGKDAFGAPVVTDLVRMPHLLIAGATGSGKSLCIHGLICSLLFRFRPEEVRLLMIDPKVLELITYNGIPHLLTPVVTDPREAVRALKWAVMEMEERYQLLAKGGVRTIEDYNRRVVGPESGAGLPLIVILIDELADLILTQQAEFEEPLARLAQMARGVGIHIILATQRPSVDVLTGVIKANFPSRISFQVATKVDSRTVIDMNGAEQLLGSGDMLFLPAGSSLPRRVHGSYLSSEELERIVESVRRQAPVVQEGVPEGAPTIMEELEAREASPGGRDPLFEDAVRVVLRHRQGSTSLLQRRLKIGYSRAARIVDQLEAAGVLSPPDASKPREVLIDESYLQRIHEDGDRAGG